MTTKKSTGKLGGDRKSTTQSKASGGESPAQRSQLPKDIATIDCRAGKDRRESSERRKEHQPVPVERRGMERRAKVNRRRQIDPTTCERDYSVEEIEFMAALDAYKRRSGRMFPTCSEVLEVLQGLGYEKRPAVIAPLPVLETGDADQTAGAVELAL